MWGPLPPHAGARFPMPPQTADQYGQIKPTQPQMPPQQPTNASQQQSIIEAQRRAAAAAMQQGGAPPNMYYTPQIGGAYSVVPNPAMASPMQQQAQQRRVCFIFN